MKRATRRAGLAAALGLAGLATWLGPAGGHGLFARTPADGLTTLAPDPAAPQRAMVPFGLNLGHASTWGAEQLFANVLHNPGFEAITDGSLLTVGSVSGDWIGDAAAWAARPAGFWNGARYEVRTGAAGGRTGTVRAHEGVVGQSQRLQLEGAPAMLAAGDIVALLRDDDPTPAPLWWREAGEFRSVALPRPGSPGRQALRIAAQGGTARLSHYLDGITGRAGKLLPVNGRWRLSLWARSDGAGAVTLRARFGRTGRTAFLDASALAGPEWQRLEWDFDAEDTGPDAPLALTLEIASGSVLLDDASLEAVGPPTPGGFRPEVVAALSALRPGVLRDWQGQLGEPLANRLAPPLARRPARYRAGEHEAQHHYGLEEFLALCAAVGARPWIVGAPTWSPREWSQLGAWLTLALDRHRLPGAIVEFGNESWNPIFRPAAIDTTPALGQASDRAFTALAAGSQRDARIVSTLGAQSARPGHAAELAQASPASQSIALGPYFGYEARPGEGADALLTRWFGESFAGHGQQLQQVASAGRVPVVYEVNLHTTEGAGSAPARNAALQSPAAGVLLARQLLRASLSGARYQAVYSLSGHDAKLGDRDEFTPLFGVTRDLASPQPRLRTTGQALAILNRIAQSSIRPATCAGPGCEGLTVAYFNANQAVAVVSSLDRAQDVVVKLPCARGAAIAVETLAGSGQAVAGTCEGRQVRVTVPARSLVTLNAAS